MFGTLHTRSAAQTITRIVDAFPTEAQSQIRHTLADNLRAVVSQELVHVADGRGRRVVCEVMIVTSAIAQLIREGKTHQIPSAIGTGRRLGMQLMDQALLNLVRAGDIDPDEAFLKATGQAGVRPLRDAARSCSPPSTAGRPGRRGADVATRIHTFLELAVNQGGSDLHLVSGQPPCIRIGGVLHRVRFRELSIEDVEQILLEFMNERQIAELNEKFAVDFAYEIPGLGRFRVNVYRHARGLAAALRVISLVGADARIAGHAARDRDPGGAAQGAHPRHRADRVRASRRRSPP